ncbi:MAG: amino acid racemase [Clostridia bacterium]|jgi:aspartate racemase|nr:amino acid racemase [Clostridia bacterium]
MANKTVGILGGMGPEATVDLMSKIIRATPAKTDQEHIRLLVDNNPQVPSRIDAILEGSENPGPVLAEMAKGLENWGAEMLAIPCNTAHYYVQYVMEAVNIPVVNMIEETIQVIVASGIKNIALLATTATLKTKLYEEKLIQAGLEVILPDPEFQEEIMRAIYGVKSGDYPKAYGAIAKVLEHVQSRGAQGVIPGCTELPLIISKDNCSLEIFDPTTILAKEIVARAYNTK